MGGLRSVHFLSGERNSDFDAAAAETGVNSRISVSGACRGCGLASINFAFRGRAKNSFFPVLFFRARGRGISMGTLGDAGYRSGRGCAAVDRELRFDSRVAGAGRIRGVESLAWPASECGNI